MKNHQLILRILLIPSFLFLIAFTACKKKEIQGPKGDAGSPGGGGNANISSTSTVVVVSTEWISDTLAGTWKTEIVTLLITKDVVEKGSVKVFVDIGTSLWELPYIIGDTYTQFGYQEGKLTMQVANIHGGMPKRPVTANYHLVVLAPA